MARHSRILMFYNIVFPKDKKDSKACNNHYEKLLCLLSYKY